ncbi:hypothetical protein F2P81_025296 [Scophthalmus maximus]|uniref:Uncharacterized protein n=1 Tax=Scophthalmus maximus TaxID=52904 RepID=A0A6A4RKU7_SCOMX|nr:hypothetical protein F2P81_025296 [Scophthalmus maximus]
MRRWRIRRFTDRVFVIFWRIIKIRIALLHRLLTNQEIIMDQLKVIQKNIHKTRGEPSGKQDPLDRDTLPLKDVTSLLALEKRVREEADLKNNMVKSHGLSCLASSSSPPPSVKLPARIKSPEPLRSPPLELSPPVPDHRRIVWNSSPPLLCANKCPLLTSNHLPVFCA